MEKAGDGMREVLGLDADLDPVVLATIAANLVKSRYSEWEDRQAIVRAAMLLRQAQIVVARSLRRVEGKIKQS